MQLRLDASVLGPRARSGRPIRCEFENDVRSRVLADNSHLVRNRDGGLPARDVLARIRHRLTATVICKTCLGGKLVNRISLIAGVLGWALAFANGALAQAPDH